MQSAVLSAPGPYISLAVAHLPGVAIAVAGTFCGLWILNRGASHLGLLDQPDAVRKCHAVPVPLTGGLAILFGLYAGSMGSGVLSERLPVLTLLAAVAAVHLVDDRRGLTPFARLAIDALLALCFIEFAGGRIDSLGEIGDLTLSLGWLAIPLTILTYIGISNALNMIDGADGVAISQMTISVAALVIWQATRMPQAHFAALEIMAIAAAIAVLLANLGLLGRSLKCFLGDSGARLLGFFIVYLLVTRDSDVLSPGEGVFFVALPLLDMGAVAIERMRAGLNPLRGDRRHLHHLLLDAGVPNHLVCVVMSLVSLVLIGLPFSGEALGLGQGQAFVSFAVVAVIYGYARHAFADSVGAMARRGGVVAGQANRLDARPARDISQG